MILCSFYDTPTALQNLGVEPFGYVTNTNYKNDYGCSTFGHFKNYYIKD